MDNLHLSSNYIFFRILNKRMVTTRLDIIKIRERDCINEKVYL